MNKSFSTPLILLVVLVMLQILLFNEIEIFGIFVPFVYIYVFIVFPFQLNKTLMIVLAFLSGLLIDISFMTGGVHAGATALMVMVKESLYSLNTFKLQKDGTQFSIHIRRLGLATMAAVTSLLVFVHHLYIHLFAYFNASFFSNILDVFINTSITFLLVLTIDLIISKRIAIE